MCGVTSEVGREMSDKNPGRIEIPQKDEGYVHPDGWRAANISHEKAVAAGLPDTRKTPLEQLIDLTTDEEFKASLKRLHAETDATKQAALRKVIAAAKLKQEVNEQPPYAEADKKNWLRLWREVF